MSLQTGRRGRDWSEIAVVTTDADGRTAPLSAAAAQSHRLVFDLHGRGGFYPEVAITFEVGGDEDHLHVPLLLSPFEYTTYGAPSGHVDRLADAARPDRRAGADRLRHEGGGLIREVYTAEYDRAVEYVSD